MPQTLPLDHEQLTETLRRAADLAARYLAGHEDPEQPVVHYLDPDALAERFDFLPGRAGKDWDQLFEEMQRVLQYSVRTGHPAFSNQLYGSYNLPAIVGEWFTALLNTSMYTYEVAPVATLMERAILGKMAGLAGFAKGEGVLTPGGSMSNLMAVLTARNLLFPATKIEGMAAGPKLALFVSEESHYSLKRAGNVLGLGLNAVHPVPTDRNGRMIPTELEWAIASRVQEGWTPFFVAATAGTTVQTAYDSIREITPIARACGAWMHVDAAYGGGALLSRKHRHLLDGCAEADSLTWCPHKMMDVPLLCSALLLREPGRLEEAIAIEADYLFHDDCCGSAYDLGHRSLQCGRRIDVLKLYLSWHALGDDGYEERIDRKFELAQTFKRLVQERPNFVLEREPQGCNVCYHFVPPSIAAIADEEERRGKLDRFTRKIRLGMKQQGRILTNFATVDGIATFRIVANNPDATEADLVRVLDEIERLAREPHE
jgi:glutamate/tyrosine decarboxylase-like PLP-dependent enzyme